MLGALDNITVTFQSRSPELLNKIIITLE